MKDIVPTLIYVLIAFLIGAAATWLWIKDSSAPEPTPVSIESFEECAERYPVMESYPPQCVTPEGKRFTQDIGNELSKMNFIRIDSPRPNAVISSPLSISGTARGNWYFEASFPVELRDEKGNILVQHYAEAQGEWMTTEFVPFKSTLTFTKPASGTKGTLILRKDNPSGLPENDDSLIIPVRF